HRNAPRAGDDPQAVTATELEDDGERDEAAADQAERGRATEGGYALGREVGLPRRHPARQCKRSGPERDVAADGVPASRRTVRLGVIPVDREAGPGIWVVPRRLAEPLCRGRRRQQCQSERQRCALHKCPLTPEETVWDQGARSSEMEQR